MKEPQYKPYIDKLLKIAKANPEARADLEDSLERAEHSLYEAYLYQDRPPARLVKQVHRHLAKTIELVEKLDQYSACWPGLALSWPRAIENGGWKTVTVQEALRDIESQIGKPVPGPPVKYDQRWIVSDALRFFVHHSPVRPSADFKNPFREFCELFYRATSGKVVKEGGLEHHIKEALKQAKEASRHKVAD
jgi:hypothetical protein